MFLYNKQGRLVRVAFCVQYAFVMLLNNYQSEFFLQISGKVTIFGA